MPREELDEETDEICDVCTRPMVIKSGRFGRFLSCSGFPECRNSRPLLERVGVGCPECDGDLVGAKAKEEGRQKVLRMHQLPHLLLRCQPAAAPTAVPGVWADVGILRAVQRSVYLLPIQGSHTRG